MTPSEQAHERLIAALFVEVAKLEQRVDALAELARRAIEIGRELEARASENKTSDEQDNADDESDL